MAERIIRRGEVEICTEDFGDAADQTILMIMGATASGVWWDEQFIGMLVDGGRRVIRYDNRDTGQSTCVDFRSAPYTLDDLTDDALAVLDAYETHGAHVVGTSMGGYIALKLALSHPAKVRTLTLLFSSPAVGYIASGATSDPGESDLPPATPECLERFRALAAHQPTTREERIESRIGTFEALAGSRYPFAREYVRRIVEQEHDRARDWNAMSNHQLAGLASGADLRPRLGAVRAPTLVFHGTEDPMIPVEHGIALARGIPNARLVTLEGYGHEFSPEIYGQWAALILGHTA